MSLDALNSRLFVNRGSTVSSQCNCSDLQLDLMLQRTIQEGFITFLLTIDMCVCVCGGGGLGLELRS